jgi:hypothetical protein
LLVVPPIVRAVAAPQAAHIKAQPELWFHGHSFYDAMACGVVILAAGGASAEDEAAAAGGGCVRGALGRSYAVEVST